MSINCAAALERLLEAEPTELQGHGDSELAIHVRGCARCQAIGTKLLAGQEQLATALGELRPAVGVDQALSLVRARRSRAGRWQAMWEWTPVAAAAAAAAVMILQSVGGGRLADSSVVMAPPMVEPLVEMTTEQSVMVFESRDQSAKVIWFY